MPAYGSIPKVSREAASIEASFVLDEDDDDDDTKVAIEDALSRHGKDDEAKPLLANGGGAASPTGGSRSPQQKLQQLGRTLRETWRKLVAYLHELLAGCWNDDVQRFWRDLWTTITTSLQSCGQTLGTTYSTATTYVHERLSWALHNDLMASLSLLWSNLVFNWFTPVLYRGNEQKKLDPEDMDLVPFPDHCDTQGISDTFRQYWEQELLKQQQQQSSSRDSSSERDTNDNNNKKKRRTSKSSPPTPSLALALAHSFGREFCTAGLLKLIHDCCIFVGPQVLNAMIYYLRDADAPRSRGLGLTALVTVSQLCMSFCLRHYFFSCYMVGLKIRTAVVVAVYQKALVLAAGERQTRTVGEITNLMSIDAKRLQGMYLLLSIFVVLYARMCGSSVGHVSTYLRSNVFLFFYLRLL